MWRVMELQLQLKTFWLLINTDGVFVICEIEHLNCFLSGSFFINWIHFSFCFSVFFTLKSTGINCACCSANKNNSKYKFELSAAFKQLHITERQRISITITFFLSSRWNNQQWKSEWSCHIQCDIRGGQSSHWVSRNTAGGTGPRAHQQWRQNR